MRKLVATFLLVSGALVGCSHPPVKTSSEKASSRAHRDPGSVDRSADRRAKTSEAVDPAQVPTNQEPRKKCSFDSECPLVDVCDFGHCHS